MYVFFLFLKSPDWNEVIKFTITVAVAVAIAITFITMEVPCNGG